MKLDGKSALQVLAEQFEITKIHSKPKPVIMISSSVYFYEDLLDQIYAVLEGWGYTVWMSHKGTVPVHPGKTAFDNCLQATRSCDLFLGLIRPFYSTGRNADELSSRTKLVSTTEITKNTEKSERTRLNLQNSL